ncbi:hypothetical protein BS50DRAFT_367650 [Corynespora cassiicola Philippines]|uniref:Velvet domain-containing protein n=1 Tax=Corynespora cassiicola Philippines TaxID=1448308 RepID=A0A2T2NSU5_CORCC|nr:hypothetical protein BS50DRAFT_367650 [Corynespora cassiicola Philippines]
MATIPVHNETKSSAVRSTKDGRQIRYQLNVIQQPERARACGSGAKSSADRRPVDPPPIVELRVFEGEQEITFAYNANFFLFATLENARSIAPGRAPPTTPSFPVLTGTPVAGMAYLDRPTPAGYFIFPDLSVRHEGKYRLSFALYEELKDPKDMDDDRSAPNVHAQGGVDAHVSHRLEVKSMPFVVFSAKKFPGLSESTALSRMVAEQGCRVRIRRDVRMRRRENKGSKDWDDYDEEGAYDQARRQSATPDTYGQQPGMPAPNQPLDGSDRPRSVSNASSASFAPPRRPSMEEMAQPYQPSNGYSSMAPPQPGYSQMSQYGSSQSQYQNQYAPPQPAPAPMMQPPQPPYSHQSHQPAHNNYPSQSGMHMGQSYNNYMSNQSYQQPQYEQPAPVRQEPPVEYAPQASEFRRPSLPQTTQQYPGPSQMIPPYSPMDQYSHSRSHSISHQVQPLQSPSHNPPVSTPSSMHMSNPHSLAPLKTLQPPAPADNKLEPVSPSYQSPPNSMSSAPMSAASEAPQNYSSYAESRVSLPKFTQPLQSSLGQKRSFSSTFDSKHLNDRLQQGARPNPTGPGYTYDGVYDEPDMEEPMERSAMSYRRADGTHRQRRVPDLAV